MDPISQRAKEIFVSLVDGTPEAEWERKADEACQGDEALRHRVRALLLAHAQPDSRLDQPAVDLSLTVQSSTPITELPGTVIGRYKLLERIGEGGFGVVFMAEQEEPVRRKVAVKIIKPGMDTKEVIARFEAERQALAIMDHPNIARVLDAGATDSGRPFFVMELVRGIPITSFCDQNSLSTRERLELFAAVCQAVQHAHQKGIIHRDIKPSNVMVTLRDDRPIPKVIDFGVAKATNQRLTEKTVFTRFAQMIGTPLYMSPEQAGMSEVDVDTRSDIYSLGVLLYELLTGSTPFDQQRLRDAAYEELLRIIREEEPPRPSLRISTLGDTLPSVAAHRKTEPKKLSAIFRGELDWIVMKSLEKDRTRRYETATGFANDIQRYLNDEAVVACPPSAGYRLRKFSRRNKVALATIGIVAMTMLMGLIGTSWQAIRATNAEQQAQENERLAIAERDEKETARRDAMASATRARAAAEAERQAKEAEVRQRELAMAASQQERQQREEADRLRRLAEEKELLARQNLYAAHMNLASQAWDNGHTTRVHRLLRRHVPGLGEPDWRRFEWYYLLGQCHRDRLTIQCESVSNVAFSPDSRLMAVGNREDIEIWDVANAKRIETLKGQRSHLHALSFSPDGKRLVSGSFHEQDRPGECLMWDVETGRIVKRLSGIEHTVTAVVFSSDGKVLAAADGGNYDVRNITNSVRLWNAETGAPLKEFLGHMGMITSMAFSNDGRRLVTADANNKGVRVWNVETGEPMQKGAIQGDYVAWSPDGALIATSTPLALWNAITGEKIRELAIAHMKDSHALGLAFSPDGSHVALAMHRDNSVRVCEVATGEEIAVLKGHANWVWRVAFSPDGRWLASTGRDGTVRLWSTNFDSGNLLAARESPWRSGFATGRNHLAVSPDGSVLAATVDVRKVAIVELDSRRVRATFDTSDTVRVLAFSPDGKQLVVGSNSRLQIRDPATGEATHEQGGMAKALAFSPDGSQLFVGRKNKVVLYEMAGLADQATLPWQSNNGHIEMLAVSRDGKYLAAKEGSFKGVVHIWDLSRSQLLASFSWTRWVTNIAFSPDGKMLAASGGSWFDARSAGTTKLWDVDTCRELATLQAHDGLHTALAFSPNGTTLATASDIGEITLWDLDTYEERITLRWEGREVDCLVFSQDGRTMISGSTCEEVRLWESASVNDVAECTTNALSWQANQYRKSKDWKNAIAIYSHLLRDQDNSAIRSCRAITHCEAGQWMAAVDDFSESIRIEPDQEVVHYWHALACLGVGDKKRYRDACVKMVQQFTGNESVSVRHWLAWTCALGPESVSDLAQAVDAAGYAVSAEPAADQHLNTLGAILYRAGRYNEAVEWTSEIAKQDSKAGLYSPAYARFFLAMAHHKLGHHEEGQAWLKRAIDQAAEETRGDAEVAWNRRLTLALLRAEAESLRASPAVDAEPSDQDIPRSSAEVEPRLSAPYHWVLDCRRARRFAAEGNWTEAARAFSQATKLRPDDGELWKDSAQAYFESRQWDQAIESYGQVIKLNPDDAMAYISRSNAHRQKGNYSKAIDDCTSALRIDQKSTLALVRRAIAYRNSGHLNEALDDTNTGLLSLPDHVGLLHERAVIYETMEQWDKAFADYEKAIELAPSNHFLYKDRARAHKRLEQWAQAIEDYGHAIRLKPEDPTLYALRGEANLALGRYHKVLADCDKYVDLQPDDAAVAALIRAQILLMAGRTEEYRQACREMLDRFGQSKRLGDICHAVCACTLAPKAVPDPMVPIDLAARAVSYNPCQWHLHTLGMAHFRAGQLDEAAKCLQESLKTDPTWEGRFLNWLGLALVHHARGETEETRKWLDKAADLMEQHPAGAAQARIEGQLLRREVEQLLGDPEQAKDDTESGSEE